jgi:hypothetical protein
MLHRVALVRADVSEELSAYIIRVRRIGELGALVVTSNRRTLHVRSETSVPTRVTRRNIAADAILHGRRREILKSYIFPDRSLY